jgi:hypothetical protein
VRVWRPQEEALRSCELLEAVRGLPVNLPPSVNGFRQPLWCFERSGTALPSFANGWLFGWASDGRGGL